MRSNIEVSVPGGEDAERAAVVAGVIAAERALATAQAAAVRAFARAGAYAERVSRSNAVREREMAMRSVAAEIACATRLSDRTVQRRMSDADTLVSGFPETVTAWEAGRITQGHVRAVVDAGLPLAGEDRELFDQAAVPVCEAETPAGAKHLLGMLAEKLHPRTLTERHQEARENRGVRVVPLEDGMAELVVILPALLAHAIHDRLTQQGRLIKNARERTRRHVTDDCGAAVGVDVASARERERQEVIASDDRTVDHIRADLVADMLLTSTPGADPTVTGDQPGELGAIRATIQVVVPVLTAAGVSEDPAELTGRSPIDPDTARRLLGNSTAFARVLTHPITGTMLTTDRYTPTAAMTRHLQARDQHCRFPGCRTPAIHCDIDHTIPHAHGGPTRTDNLAHLCRRHHTLKHTASWTVTQHPGGTLHWTTPLGHTHTTTPPTRHGGTARFTPDNDPPPF
ncbi:HNH endonuclease signature motif containing protein [Microbacterium sp. cx-59]|uniref:HNH endonuclease signature motif containing protein n=1 Tax=Microbacterium sp. cx-59 TaxID=2891207 RepID=UPI001E537629|nr:HNH endonuclease signature motif containing protein [Microbacterium sp. cx-59]MCC4907556.1 HNH endonuclease [Microbacterium sp. cx-59]